MATFVGTSNVLSAPSSRERLLGVDAAHSLRPERIRLDGAPAGDDEVCVDGVLSDIQYLGSECRVRVELDDGSHLLASVPSDAATTLADRRRGPPDLAAAGGVRRGRHRDRARRRRDDHTRRRTWLSERQHLTTT